MARNFRELESKMTPERLSAAKRRAKLEMEQMLLSELRKRAGRAKEAVAAELGMDGQSYAELEDSDDMPIGTLQRLVRALGGELDIVVHLPDREIALSQFAETVTPT